MLGEKINDVIIERGRERDKIMELQGFAKNYESTASDKSSEEPPSPDGGEEPVYGAKIKFTLKGTSGYAEAVAAEGA